MEIDWILMVICMSVVVLSEWLCTTEAVVVHLVYIAVILRPLHSIIIIIKAMYLCLLDSIPAEVSDNLLKREL